MTLQLAISTCPNDTYAFSGLLSGAVDTGGLDVELTLLDIAELNRRLFAGEFDVAKASFHAALYLTEATVVLPVGAALGFGVGPLLLARPADGSPADGGPADGGPSSGDPDRLAGARVLCPGPHTTATLLYRMFYPEGPAPQHAVFSDIMPALQRGEADFGVCIHEGRFTWRQSGLHLVADLGARWEQTAGGPLPLGGLLARRHLGPQATAVTELIQRSIAWADAHPDAALSIMRRHAQELSDPVLWNHVELYVNAETRALSATGRAALQHMFQQAQRAGVVSPAARALTVL